MHCTFAHRASAAPPKLGVVPCRARRTGGENTAASAAPGPDKEPRRRTRRRLRRGLADATIQLAGGYDLLVAGTAERRLSPFICFGLMSCLPQVVLYAYPATWK